MKDRFIIVIYGPWGAGKTTMGREISTRLDIPFIGRDAIKELLFDDLGWSDRDLSSKLGRASYSLLYFFTEKLLSTGRTFIIESNFNIESINENLKDMCEKYNYKLILIKCYADKQILFERVIKRDESGERHTGHIYPTNYSEYKNRIIENYDESIYDHSIEDSYITEGNWNIIRVDTTSFSNNIYDSIINTIIKISNENQV